MKKLLQIANGIAFGSTVFINGLSNSGLMNNTTIGEVSGDLNTLFTPAGYAFSIWGLIYLMLLAFCIYQGRSLFVSVKNDDFVETTGWWFVISCFFNSAWVFCWIYEYTGLSVLCIFGLLISLLVIVYKNRMEIWDAPIDIIAFLWWPFVIYSGWVTVASIANVSAYLKKLQWDGLGISDESWTLVMILIAGMINLLITWQRNMREFALVGAWALVAIAIANQDYNRIIELSAYGVAGVLVLSSMVHGIKNWKTNPLFKLQEALKK